MDVALSAAKWHFAFVYVGDNVVFSCSAAKRIDHLEHVLTLLRDVRPT